jgi:hypothetical protein
MNDGDIKTKSVKFTWRLFLSILALTAVLVIHTLLPAYQGYRVKVLPYFTRLLYVLIGGFTT